MICESETNMQFIKLQNDVIYSFLKTKSDFSFLTFLSNTSCYLIIFQYTLVSDPILTIIFF